MEMKAIRLNSGLISDKAHPTFPKGEADKRYGDVLTGKVNLLVVFES